MFINWEQTIINILNYILSAVSVKINIVNTHAHGLVDFSLNLFHLLCVSVFFAYLFFRCEMIFDFSLFFYGRVLFTWALLGGVRQKKRKCTPQYTQSTKLTRITNVFFFISFSPDRSFALIKNLNNDFSFFFL